MNHGQYFLHNLKSPGVPSALDNPMENRDVGWQSKAVFYGLLQYLPHRESQN